MNRPRVLTRIAALFVLFGLLALPLLAQQAGGQGQRPGPAGPKAQAPAKPPAEARRAGDRSTEQDRDRDRIRLSEVQRAHYRACEGSIAQAREGMRKMRQLATGTPDLGAMRQERDRLRKQVQAMDREYWQLREQLSEEQRAQVRNRLQTLERDRDQLRVHQRSLDNELDSSRPMPRRLSNRTREVERSMERWHTQYHKLGEDLGIPPAA